MTIKTLNILFNKGEVRIVKSIFNSMPQKWQKEILDNLKSIGEQEITEILVE